MSSQPVEHLHPVVEFADRVTVRLEKLADQPLFSMTPAQKRTALALSPGPRPSWRT
jgi:hypothetical protein